MNPILFGFDWGRRALVMAEPGGQAIGIPLEAIARVRRPDGEPFWKIDEAGFRAALPRFDRPAIQPAQSTGLGPQGFPPTGRRVR